ncbi:hypothetical protein EJ110_NYTH57855, partial [Nymphaea thermarum]
MSLLKTLVVPVQIWKLLLDVAAEDVVCSSPDLKPERHELLKILTWYQSQVQHCPPSECWHNPQNKNNHIRREGKAATGAASSSSGQNVTSNIPADAQQLLMTAISKLQLKQNEQGEWYVDSGAAAHVTGDAAGETRTSEDSYRLMNSTQAHIAAGLCYYNTAKDMWNSLRQTYSQDKNISKILQVQQELLQMQQGDMNLTEYFTKLKFAYEKMNSLKPPCKHCLKSHMEQMIVVKFLAGLSSDYSASKAQMLTGSDFPDLDEAFNRLNRLAVTLPPSSNNMQPSALASFGGGRGGPYSSRSRGRGRGPGGHGRLQCTFCGRLGHLEDRCWNKVGKPNTSTSQSVTSSSSPTPNTRPIPLAPKANPTVAS